MAFSVNFSVNVVCVCGNQNKIPNSKFCIDRALALTMDQFVGLTRTTARMRIPIFCMGLWLVDQILTISSLMIVQTTSKLFC